MIINKSIIDKVRKEPLVFAEVLKIMNENQSIKVMPDTLMRRLQRYSEVVRSSVAIAEYFKSKGLTEEEIFETETEKI